MKITIQIEVNDKDNSFFIEELQSLLQKYEHKDDECCSCRAWETDGAGYCLYCGYRVRSY